MTSASDASSVNEQTTKTTTAAEKVFSIGELVENILIHLPDTSVEKQREPFFQFFVLQSLNSTTNIAIKSSKMLRQHMYLEPRDSTSAAARIPAVWVLRQLGIQVDSYFTSRYEFGLSSLSLNGASNCKVHGYLRDCIAAFSGVEAYRDLTWTHIKILSRHDSGRRSLELRVQIGSEYIWHFGLEPKELTKWWRDGVLNATYTEEWEYGEDSTVGDLLDKYLEVMRRTPAEHRLRQRAHLTAVRGRD